MGGVLERADVGQTREDDVKREYETLCAKYDKMTGARQITVDALQKYMHEGEREIIILDIREEREHLVSTLPGAKLLVPSVGLLRMSYMTPPPASVPPNKMVVCHCTAGLRSGWAAVDLERKWKRPVYSLHGGIISWANASGVLVTPRKGDEGEDRNNCPITEKVHTYSAKWGRYLKAQENAVF